MKKLISLCFAIALCFALSVAAMAAQPTTLKVNGMDVVINGNGASPDYNEWSYEDGVLTLKGYDSGPIYVEGDLKIYLAPNTENNVSGSFSLYDEVYAAIYVDGLLEIEGTGTLNANADSEGSGTYCGIYATGSGLTVKEGTVNAYGGPITGSGSSYGIFANNGASVNVSGGSVTAKGDKVMDSGKGVSHGIFVPRGDFGITEDTARVTAIGNWDPSGSNYAMAESYGILAREVNISSGSVTATGGCAVDSMGIKATVEVNIEGGSVTATAGVKAGQAPLSVGIYGDKDITISGGNVTAKGSDVDKTAGDSYGIYSHTGNIDMSKLEEKSSITAEGQDRSMLAAGNIIFPKAFKYITETGGAVESGTDQTDMSAATAGSYLEVYTEESNEVEINIAISWSDGDNINGLRPDEVEFKILADGSETDTVTLTSENEWKTSVTLPKKDNDGESILYGVELASEIEGYNASVTNENYNYTAKLSLTTHHVSYDPNGGEGLVTDITIYKYGDSATVKEGSALSKTDCAFAGWNTEADGSGTDYAPGDEITVKGNITLYAVWEDVSVIGTPNKKPERPDPCEHDFDEDGLCKECGIKVTFYADGKPVVKPTEETNPNTGAEGGNLLGAVLCLGTALCLGKSLVKTKRK